MTGWEWLLEVTRVALCVAGLYLVGVLGQFVVYYEHKVSRRRSHDVRRMMLGFIALDSVVMMNAFDRMVNGFRANWVSPFALGSIVFCILALRRIQAGIASGASGGYGDATLTAAKIGE